MNTLIMVVGFMVIAEIVIAILLKRHEEPTQTHTHTLKRRRHDEC